MKTLAYALVFLIMFLLGRAAAAPLEMVARQTKNEHKITGKITVRDPVTDQVIGVYEFVSGGHKRGAAPFGPYEIGKFLGDKWLFHHPDAPDGEVWDERWRDMRFAMQIHANGQLDWTEGCIGVLGDQQTWNRFMMQLHMLIASVGVLKFELKPTDRENLPISTISLQRAAGGYQ